MSADVAEVAPVFQWLLTLALLALVATLSLTPNYPGGNRSIIGRVVAATPARLQKLLHVLFYATLAATLWWTLETMTASRIMRALLALGIPVSTGVVLEALQSRIPGRFAASSDVVLNGVGAGLGLAIAVMMI